MRDQAIAKHRRPRKAQPKPDSTAKDARRLKMSFGWVPRVLSVLTYLVVLISAGWLLYYSVVSPYFQVQDIAVSGTKLLDPAQVQDTSGVLGSNALLIRTEAVEQSVLKITAAREARAEVTLGGKVAIDVAERTPLVQWQAREGSFLVDKEGVVFGQYAPQAPLVVVRDIDGPAMEIGSRVDPAVLTSVSLLDSTLPAKAGFRPEWYDYSRASGISVQMVDGPRIIFGDADDLDAKLSALGAVVDHLQASKYRAESIDLRFRGRPTYILAPSAPVKQGQSH